MTVNCLTARLVLRMKKWFLQIMNEDIKWIRSHVETGDYQFRKHAAERASERGINPLDVKESLLNGVVI